MFSLEPFKIDLKKLGAGETTLRYSLTDSFFEAIDAPDIRRGDLEVVLTVKKIADFFEIGFHSEGEVVVPCDRCLEDMDQPIVSDNIVTVKLGEEYAGGDDVITIPEDDGIYDAAWTIYEFVELAVPIKHVHPDGECNEEMIKTLEEHSPERKSAKDDDGDDIDPRWNKLKELKI